MRGKAARFFRSCSTMRRAFYALLALSGAVRPAGAQNADSAQPAVAITGMGQPPAWQPYLSAFGLAGNSSARGGGALVGLQRPLLNPITGLLAVSAEAFADRRAQATDNGLRLLANVPAFGISGGANWYFNGGVHRIFTFEVPVRRGGFFGNGSMLRVDWLPAEHSIAAGVDVPLMQPLAGRTRPRQTDIDLRRTVPRPEPAEAEASEDPLSDSTELALAAVARMAEVVSSYVILGPTRDEDVLAGLTPAAGFDAAAQAYRDQLARAFGVAAGNVAQGERIAAAARSIAFDRVILPYDTLFGRPKAGSGTLEPLLAVAQDAFARWLRESSGATAQGQQRLLAVNRRWLALVEAQRARQQHDVNDSRLVWLAPQLALAPSDYDSQEKIDGLLSRAVGHPFTDRNALRYLRTADLPLEIARSILAARRYHVLWTHDFTGRLPTGALDEVSYTMVADAYLPALTAAVKRYDSTGVMTEYILLVDAFYYHARAGALWLSILENPLTAAIRLRRDEQAQAAHLRQRLDELRDAVSRSVRLQREAAAQGGDRWLRKVVRVQVSVTLPADWSFRSRRTVPPIPFVPDNIIRDHRKIVLYDLTEANPYAGALLDTGIGIGEQYASVSWEDRGLEVRGPAALNARVALRRTLASNGLRADRIPPPLRTADTTAAGRTPTTDTRSYVGRALEVHNDAGFGAKEASVARAILYSLAPAGTVIIVPDPLWVSDTWAAMLAGAAARGCQVVIAAPARANSPNPEPAVMALESDILHRMLTFRRRLGDRIAAAGGALHIGVFAGTSPATDVTARLAEIHAGLARAPWIRRMIPFDDSTLALLDRALAQAAPSDRAATSIARDVSPHAPQLHSKTVLVGRAGAIAALVRQPGWADILARTLREQSRQTARLADAIGAPLPPADTAADRAADALLQGYERTLSPAERKQLSFYFANGSQNHDPRGLMLDGESVVIVSGVHTSAGLVDLFYLLARTTWVQDDSEIDPLVRPPAGMMARIARILRSAM